MEIKGKVIQMLPLRQGTSQRTGNPWKLQEYILETYDTYPKKVMFSLFGDNVDKFPIQVGEDVNVSFDLDSRSYVGRDGVERWSTDVRAWKVEKVDPASVQAPAYGAPAYGAPAYGAPADPTAQPAPAVGQFPSQPGDVPAAPNPTEDLPF